MAILATNTDYRGQGVPDTASLMKFQGSFEGLGDLGFDWGSFITEITKGGMDLAKGILTPPTYRSTGPGGTTEIRGVTGTGYAQAGSTGIKTQVPESLLGGVSMPTLMMVGAGLLAVVLLSRR
jgi:hypothetical protein